MSTVARESDNTIVVDAATIQPWHRTLTPAERTQAIGELLEQGGQVPARGDDDLTSKEAAKLLGLAKPDGKPRDSFYSLTDKLGGYYRPGGWRFPRSRVEAFKRNGGIR